MSSNQLAQYLSLLLGLTLPSLPTPSDFATVDPPYLLLATISSIVPSGLGDPGRTGMILWKRLGIRDSPAWNGCSGFGLHHEKIAHPTTQKRGEIAVTSDGHLQITNAVDRHPSSDFTFDVKVCAMVTGDRDWKARWNADKNVLEDHTLTQAEDEKFRKHET